MQQLEEIVNEFLLLSKREFVSYEVVNLNEMLAELVEDLSQKAADRKINIVEAYGSIDVEYRCIRSHIKQVMMNLINNGIESMPNGGQLKTKLLKTENGEILIEVEDHGDGIPDHLINRLGEPYYQTSEKGTGLGLMVSYKVIKEHGGHIEVTSKKHEGTVFLIKLPANPSFVHMEKEE